MNPTLMNPTEPPPPIPTPKTQTPLALKGTRGDLPRCHPDSAAPPRAPGPRRTVRHLRSRIGGAAEGATGQEPAPSELRCSSCGRQTPSTFAPYLSGPFPAARLSRFHRCATLSHRRRPGGVSDALLGTTGSGYSSRSSVSANVKASIPWVSRGRNGRLSP